MTEQVTNHSLIIMCAAIPIFIAALSDLKSFTIPNGCSLTLMALYPLHASNSPVHVDVFIDVFVASITFVVCYAFYAMGRLGGGDVKLLSAVALWAGSAYIDDFLITMALSGGVMALLLMSPAKMSLALVLERGGHSESASNLLADKLPYGIAIAFGGLVVLSKLSGIGA